MNILSPGYGYFANFTIVNGNPLAIRIVVCETCRNKIASFYDVRERERSDANQNTLWLGVKRPT